MRTFADESGTEWDVTVGRASWGSFVLLFAPAAGGPARKQMMASESALEAEQELDGLTEDELRQRLHESEPWADEG